MAPVLPDPPKPLARKASLFDRLRDQPGNVAGMPGWEIKSQLDATFCGGSKIITIKRKRKLEPEQQPLANVYALAFPSGLSFAEPATKAASMKAFEVWMKTLESTAAAAQKYYEVMIQAEPAAKAHAAARLAQVSFRIAEVLVRAEIPKDVRTGEFAADKIMAFCDEMEEVAEPLVKRGEEALGLCAGITGGATGWWSSYCVTAASAPAPSP
jgi:hypothetical protein